MNWLDPVILAGVAIIALVGWRIGGLHIGVMGAGIIAGIALASRLHDRVSPLFSRFISSENGAEIAAFILIFSLVIIASAAIGFAVHIILRRLMLGWAEKVVGLGLGVAIALAIGSATFSALQSYPVLGLENTIEGSTLGTFMADNFDSVLRGLKFIPGDLGA